MPKSRRKSAPLQKKYNQQIEQQIAAIADPVNQNIETIARIHHQMESEIDHHQRTIEKITALLSRPAFLYFIIVVMVSWIMANLLLIYVGLHAFDPEPFTWLLETINIGSFLLTTVVLITQNRQGKVAEQRRHLDLQFSMLIEQKVTKILTMLEELRDDLPQVESRLDPEVEAMKHPVDPHQVLNSLDQMLKEDLLDDEENVL
ncbi:DUF1003 domain-containing protein [Tengunoibacter tsumagoiensis]|uniref:Membrane protein n=1 Tax=Tengunoibacter tsumagoiensis TaxID=2014871 RepID=A0A402A5R2_9CHLR|nr:DUF1003 domain-containing protein [Tengunoibacter tsumagoiensis]GCE14468.1 membrane protein [Tengunoibacter tsumagoiensis]